VYWKDVLRLCSLFLAVACPFDFVVNACAHTHDLLPRQSLYTHAHLPTGAPKLPQNNRKISQTVEGIRGSAQFLNRVLASDLSILG